MSNNMEFSLDDWSIAEKLTHRFERDCRQATISPRAFRRFRQLRGVRSVTENKSDKCAYDRWSEFCKACPNLIEQAHLLQQNDRDGSPRLIPVPELDISLSPSTMKYAGDYATLRTYFGSLDGMRIVEIGGGYGNLAAVIHLFSDVKSYTVYDMPHVVTLQEKYLQNLGYSDVQFKTDLNETSTEYDLVLSCAAFSELTVERQDEYLHKILKPSTKGWLVYASPHLPNLRAKWSCNDIYNWLRKEMSPTQVEWPWKNTEYTNLFSGLQWTYIWGNNLTSEDKDICI